MTSILQQKILTRGYWQVIIRPVSFLEKRIADFTSLRPLVDKNRVSLRGWDFPHVDYKNREQIGIDWAGQEFDWQHHKSIWRFYQSGQFFQLKAFAIDWRDESSLWPADENWRPKGFLGIGDTVATLLEIFEFAARLAVSEAGADVMHINILAGNLDGRLLYIDSSRPRWSLDDVYKTSLIKFPYSINLQRSKLLAEAQPLALQVAKEIFSRFGLNMEPDTLRSWQDEANNRY